MSCLLLVSSYHVIQTIRILLSSLLVSKNIANLVALYLINTIFSGGANVLNSSFALASFSAFLNSQSKVNV